MMTRITKKIITRSRVDVFENAVVLNPGATVEGHPESLRISVISPMYAALQRLTFKCRNREQYESLMEKIQAEMQSLQTGDNGDGNDNDNDNDNDHGGDIINDDINDDNDDDKPDIELYRIKSHLKNTTTNKECEWDTPIHELM